MTGQELLGWLPTVAAIVLLAGIAFGGLAAFRIPAPHEVIVAVARAALQLAALSLVLSGVITHPLWVGLGLVVMFAAAVFTSARRTRGMGAPIALLASSMALGPCVAMAIVFGTGALAFEPRYLLAVGGIVVGNTMTIATLTLRLLDAGARDHWDEIEGWLALGATPRRAFAPIARPAVRNALMPSIDQTRTTGLVVLPGAFVGAVFAGASPIEAGTFQLIVLASILASGVITATLLAFRQPQLRKPPPLVAAA